MRRGWHLRSPFNLTIICTQSRQMGTTATPTHPAANPFKLTSKSRLNFPLNNLL